LSTRRVRVAAWVTWGVVMAVLAAGLALAIWNARTVDAETGILYAILLVAALAYATVGALVASRHPRNPVGWLFLLAGLGFAAWVMCEEYAVRGLLLSPGSLPAAELIGYQADWVPIVAAGSIPLVFLLFPNGRPLSAQWRPLSWVASACLVGIAAVAVVGWTPQAQGLADRWERLGIRVTNPIGIRSFEPVAQVIAFTLGLALAAMFLASVVSLVLRFRRARGEERQQVRWLAYAGAVAAGILLLAPFSLGEEATVIGNFFWFSITLVLALGVPVASGIAVLKYRLYDLDIVVKKTVVLGALLALLTAVYLVVVVGIGALVGGANDPVLTFAGAAVVALAFQPVRTRALRLADRLVYGKRATPYEVLSEFADRVSGTYSTEDVLPRMARLLAEGTGAREARVWLRIGEELRPAAAHPAADGETPPVPLSGEDPPDVPGADLAFPVRHRGDLLGAITVAMRPSEPPTPSQERLVRDVASQAGLMLSNVRLTEELRANLEELRASRQRIVTAQDSRAKALERNLHDGAQQQLVALTVKLRLAETLAQRDPARVAPMLVELKAEAQEALDNLRDLARGIYPPLLADKGLVAALDAQARKSTVPVTVSGDAVDRFPQEVEAGVYFCCLEALQNVAKYSAAAHASVTLAVDDGELLFSVEDDGRGFDPATTPYGAGLQNMADRIAALGGALEVRSAPGQGTTVSGRVAVSPRGDDGLRRSISQPGGGRASRYTNVSGEETTGRSP
jgi:signal transduction histidine kinase